MPIDTQETKIENLRIHSGAKTKVNKVVEKIQKMTKVAPTLSEAITIMADHYLSTAKAA